jgi:hypothetical protein
MASEQPQQHAFISYVREDAKEIDRIQAALEAADIQVWRDTANLWPGEDWRLKIREAITRGSLVFIACFSDNSANRETTYQHEELLLAIDQFRQRRPDRAWIIPVRLSDCLLPPYELGAGRTLDHLNRADLFGPEREQNIARLAAAVVRLQSNSARPAEAEAPASVARSDPTTFVKGALLDPTRQIELEDFVVSLADEAASACADTSLFPTSSDELASPISSVRFLVAQTERYWDVLDPLTNALIAGCTWGQPHHGEIWTRAVEQVVNAGEPVQIGHTPLVNLRRFPVLPLLYASGLAALGRNSLGGLKAVAVDVELQDRYWSIPLIGAAHVYRPFENAEVVTNVLAMQANDEDVSDEAIEGLLAGHRRKRSTPVSDYLHRRLRPYFIPLIASDERYETTFDRLEVLLPVLALDARAEAGGSGRYMGGAWFGRFTWRNRHVEPPIEKEMSDKMQAEGDSWPPLLVGLFGGEQARAASAFEAFLLRAESVRVDRW